MLITEEILKSVEPILDKEGGDEVGILASVATTADGCSEWKPCLDVGGLLSHFRGVTAVDGRDDLRRFWYDAVPEVRNRFGLS